MTQRNDIMLSIYVPVYNHAAYIAQALDSILMQKVDFEIEVLVGDDLSTDNTREILKRYEKEYPNFFQMFYREQNMYSQAVSNTKDLFNRCQGKYVILLEGDDYWTDAYKLQKQVDFLEGHPDFLAVAHNCTVVGRDSLPNGEQYPECKDTEYTLKHYALDIMPGQTATLMFRNYAKQPLFDASFLNRGLVPGDRCKYFTLAANGRVYCMQESMSAYRHITDGGSSFSATNTFNYEHQYNWYREQLHYAKSIGVKKALSCAEMQLMMTILYGLRKRYIPLSRALKDIKEIRHPLRAFIYLLWRWSHRLFHK